MKRLISIVTVIAAFALVICLAGCSSDESSGSSNSDEVDSLSETLDDISLDDIQTVGGMTFKVSADWNQIGDVNPYESAEATAEYEVAQDDGKLIIDFVSYPYQIEDVAETLKTRDGVSDMSYNKARYNKVSDDGYTGYRYTCDYESEASEGYFVVISAPSAQYVINVMGVNGDKSYCLKMVNTILETIEIDNDYVISDGTEPATEEEAAPEPEAEENTADDSVQETSTERSHFLNILAGYGEFDAVTLSGSGDDVVDLPYPNTACLLDVSYTGDSNFIVHLLDASGKQLDGLINEIGAYNGTITNFNDYEDSCTLEIKAGGDWTITVRPMSSMAPLENGAAYTGSNVLYIDVDNLTKLNISNAGEGNFVVRGIGLHDAKLLVNDIGDYQGTVSWTEAECFLTVKDTKGTWSISW